MKVVKKICKVLLWMLAIALVIVLALPLWIGPVAKTAANSIAPKKIGTDFNLGEFAFNPYSGKVHVGKLTIANPPNFSKANCLDLRDLDIKLEVMSVLGDKIHVDEIVLDGLTVFVEKNGKNFEAIAKNASGEGGRQGAAVPTSEGGKQEAAVPTSEGGRQGAAVPTSEGGRQGAAVPTSEGGKQEAAVPTKVSEEAQDPAKSKGVVIDSLVLKNVVVKYGVLPIPLPTIELKDIGADKPEGASYMDVIMAVSSAIMKAVGAIGDLGKNLFKVGTEATTTTLGAANDAVETTSEAVNATVEKTGEAVNTTVEVTTEAVKGAVDAVKDLKSIFKKKK